MKNGACNFCAREIEKCARRMSCVGVTIISCTQQFVECEQRGGRHRDKLYGNNELRDDISRERSKTFAIVTSINRTSRDSICRANYRMSNDNSLRYSPASYHAGISTNWDFAGS